MNKRLGISVVAAVLMSGCSEVADNVDGVHTEEVSVANTSSVTDVAPELVSMTQIEPVEMPALRNNDESEERKAMREIVESFISECNLSLAEQTDTSVLAERYNININDIAIKDILLYEGEAEGDKAVLILIKAYDTERCVELLENELAGVSGRECVVALEDYVYVVDNIDKETELILWSKLEGES